MPHRYHLRRRGVAAMGTFVLAVAACGSDDGLTPAGDATTIAPITTTTDIASEEPNVTDAERPPATDPSPDQEALTPTQKELADLAVADIVERREVDVSDVTVVSVEEVTWSDTSLGCPQRDMQYQQVLTAGVRVVLDADGQRASYHGTSASDLRYCAAPQQPVEP